MSSLTISYAHHLDGARHDVEQMATALADRTPAWSHIAGPDISATVMAVGAESITTAEYGVRLLNNGIRLAIAAPLWLQGENEVIANLLDREDVSAEIVAAVLAGISADAHCAAILGRQVVLFRSPMSPRPLFYHQRTDRTVLVASQIRAIRATQPGLGIDVGGLAPFLIPTMCDTAGSAWRGIRRLPPGHALIIEPERIRVRQMPPLPALDLDGAHRSDLVDEFRRRLLTALQRCSGSSDAVLLSGGIDSAALTCAATVAGLTPRPFSLTYSSPELAACDERRYVDDVEATTGLRVTRLEADTLLPLVSANPIGDEPEAWTYAARNTAMLDHIATARPRVSTVVAGEGGDELLLGQVFTVADRIARGDEEGAVLELATFPNPDAASRITDALLTGSYDKRGARTMRALADLPPWLDSRYLSEHAVVDRLAQGYPALSHPGQLTTDYSRALIAEAGAAGRVHCGGWWEDAGRRAGLAITYPFLDADLASLTWSLPPQLLRDEGIEKVVLREALTDVLPASILTRPDKADARAMMHAGLRRAADQLHAVADHGPLVDHRIIDPHRLRTAVDEYLDGADHHGPGLWATVAVNSWIAHYEETAS